MAQSVHFAGDLLRPAKSSGLEWNWRKKFQQIPRPNSGQHFLTSKRSRS